jgi:hypothetical protein
MLAAYLDLHPAKQYVKACKHSAAEGSITNFAQTAPGYYRSASARAPVFLCDVGFIEG